MSKIQCPLLCRIMQTHIYCKYDFYKSITWSVALLKERVTIIKLIYTYHQIWQQYLNHFLTMFVVFSPEAISDIFNTIYPNVRNNCSFKIIKSINNFNFRHHHNVENIVTDITHHGKTIVCYLKFQNVLVLLILWLYTGCL